MTIPTLKSQFKTLKYRPEFPDRFGAIEDARSFCQVFFPWYNKEHRHTGIGLLTPEVVHYGQAEAVLRARKEVLHAAYQQHPERFVRKEPSPQPLPEAVWINPPQTTTSDGKLHKIQPTGVSKSLTNSACCLRRGRKDRSLNSFVLCSERCCSMVEGSSLRQPPVINCNSRGRRLHSLHGCPGT